MLLLRCSKRHAAATTGSWLDKVLHCGNEDSKGPLNCTKSVCV